MLSVSLSFTWLGMKNLHSDATPAYGLSFDFEYVTAQLYGLKTYLCYYAAPVLGLTFVLQLIAVSY